MKRIAVVLLVFLFFYADGVYASVVQDQLKSTIDEVIEIVKNPSLKGEENTKKRRGLLRKAILERFSFAKMSQLSLGKHWKKRSDDEKKVFIDLFGQLLENTYVSKIETCTNEKVVYDKEVVRNNKAQVYTKVITDTNSIPIDYRMYKAKDGSWKVYDIVIEGVSLIGNYRSQFNQILQKNSYEQLVEKLKEKIES